MRLWATANYCRAGIKSLRGTIVLFAFLQVHQNQQIVVLKPWLCGSVNLTANENIHHGEERTSFFCCSARFRWSRHQPGYIQGGQEVGRDYLLLRIHVRRIRSDIPIHTNFTRLQVYLKSLTQYWAMANRLGNYIMTCYSERDLQSSKERGE